MTYPGGKSGAGVFQRIINLMPPHRVYVEPFLGGGAILRHKRLAQVSIGIDKDKLALMTICRSLRERYGNGVDVRFVGVGDSLSIRGEIAGADGGPLTVLLFHGCGIEFLKAFPAGQDVLVYADPPFVRSTRKTARDIYAHEMTDDDHKELLAALVDFPGRVLLSGYPNAFYDRSLTSWSRTRFRVTTRGGMAAQKLWFNFDRPDALHDCRYLGANFREREKIRRRIARWEARLERMAPLERQAMFQAIRTKFPEISISGS